MPGQAVVGGVIRAGELDRRIRVERLIDVDDGYQRVPTWSELATLWAKYMPGRGAERREAAVTQARLPATFRIRWSTVSATVGPRDRIVFNGDTYMISSAVEVGRREAIEIVATAEV